jgi:RecA-family ATPase
LSIAWHRISHPRSRSKSLTPSSLSALGKSWLLLHAAHAVASGGFIGETHCIEGDVLYCSLEDNKRRLKSRMTKLFALRPRSARLKFMTRMMPRLADGGLEVLKNWIKSVENPRMIAIDTLAMVRMPNRKDQSAYDADYAAVIGLRDLAHEHGIAVVVVHHVRKMEADDAFDTISGTLGLTGCPDSLVILKRDTAGTQLLARGRDIEELEKAVTFNKDSCTWTIDGDADDIRRSSQQRTILNALREAEEAQTPIQVAANAGMKRENVRFLLGKMCKDGSVRKLARGRYEATSKPEGNADAEF